MLPEFGVTYSAEELNQMTDSHRRSMLQKTTQGVTNFPIPHSSTRSVIPDRSPVSIDAKSIDRGTWRSGSIKS